VGSANVKVGNLNQLPQYIKEGDLVLDVGGGARPLSRANYILDFMPWSFGAHNNNGFLLNDVWPNPYFSEDSWIQQDICAREKWPFNDKQFDFVLCRHTLEDIRDPIWVCQEIMRVGKAGYIETPSRLYESLPGIERGRYCGYSHHHWLCEITDEGIEFMFKHAQMHSYGRFHLTIGSGYSEKSEKHGWFEFFDHIQGFFFLVNKWFRKVNPKYANSGMFWVDSFLCREKVLIEKAEVERDFMNFKSKCQGIEDLWVWRRNWFGKKTD